MGPVVPDENPQGMRDEEWIAEMRRDSRKLYDSGMACERAQKRALRAGKTTGARDLGVAAGVAFDQARKLDLFADQAEERLVTRRDGIEAGRAQILASAIELFFSAVGLPWTPRTRKVLAEILRSAERAEGMSAPEPAAAEARAEIRRVLGVELERRALPPPRGADWEPEVDDEPVGAPDLHEEVTDAEVVVEPSAPAAPRPSTRATTWQCDGRTATAAEISNYRSMYMREDLAEREWARSVPEGSTFAGYQPSVTAHLRGGAR